MQNVNNLRALVGVQKKKKVAQPTPENIQLPGNAAPIIYHIPKKKKKKNKGKTSSMPTTNPFWIQMTKKEVPRQLVTVNPANTGRCVVNQPGPSSASGPVNSSILTNEMSLSTVVELVDDKASMVPDVAQKDNSNNTHAQGLNNKFMKFISGLNQTEGQKYQIVNVNQQQAVSTTKQPLLNNPPVTNKAPLLSNPQPVTNKQPLLTNPQPTLVKKQPLLNTPQPVANIKQPLLSIPQPIEQQGSYNQQMANKSTKPLKFHNFMPEQVIPPNDPYAICFPKGIPRSFLMKQPQQQNQDPMNPQSMAATVQQSPVWSVDSQMPKSKSPTWILNHSANDMQGHDANNPILVQTEPQGNIEERYSPSDVYTESSMAGNNIQENEDDNDGSGSEAGHSGQKRLSAFQRLGPLSQPKKPKLTINLMFNKEQAVREVVNVTEEDTDKYTPVHLREEVINSKNEVVAKYLPFWPWKKRFPLRKSVTYRQSRSVMILEQEKMEEIYNKDHVFIHVSVKGYPKHWNKEDVLDTLIDKIKEKPFKPCFIEFTREECKFLVLRSRPALVVIHKCGFVIRKNEVELNIVISATDISLNQIDFIPRLVLRKILLLGYDGERKLDLSRFTLNEDISHFLYFPLNRATNQTELMQLQNTVSWEYLTDLDLSHNRLTCITNFKLPSTTPRLKNLNLSYNHFDKVTFLLECRELPLNCLWLEGNPLCTNYIDSDHYVKVVKMIFPALKEIDGIKITLKGDIPRVKRNYCPDEAKTVVEKLLEVIFPLMDTSIDDRSLMQSLYTNNAVMTITYNSKLRHGPVYRSYRNLFLRSRDFDEQEMDAVEGASSIVKLINRWPEFEHDPFTFTVDVIHHSDFSTILRVGGVLKLKAESLAEDEHLLAFTRTFVLRSKDGAEYKICNELVYWDYPTEEYAASAFKVTTVKAKQLSFKLDSTPSDNLKEKLTLLFMKLTTLERKPAERCLELKDWNFKLALEHFTKLLKLDSLDSLTKHEEV